LINGDQGWLSPEEMADVNAAIALKRRIDTKIICNNVLLGRNPIVDELKICVEAAVLFG
jgi:hypothetical protein